MGTPHGEVHDNTSNVDIDNKERKGGQTQAFDLADEDIIFFMFLSDDNFRVFVIEICKFNKLHNDIWGGEEWWVIGR